jgi:predicted membrane channel-forming protein YqfA (hemolysin III family)
MPGKKREANYHLLGWVLFVLCALLFLFAALRDGNGLLALASIVFLLGCIAFLVPTLLPHKDTGGGRSGHDSDPRVEEK